MLTLIKRLFSNYYEAFLKEKEIVSLSSVLKCQEAPYFYQLTLTVHKVYIVINFISFIDNVISLYSRSEAFVCVLHNPVL